MDWKEKKVAVLGLGKSGIAAAKVLAGLGGQVSASDLRSREELEEAVSQLPPEVEIEAGGHAQSCLEAELLVVSPGVPCDLPILVAAEADGVPVMGEVELAYELTHSPIVAITGTNGKTTTTTLVGELLKAAGFNAPVGGNIGVPLVSLAQTEADYLVAEVSSFQLETVSRFRPHVGLFLNFTDDHLNRHGTMERYFSLKRRLFEKQEPSDWAILNADDPRVAGLAGELPSQVMLFSRTRPVADGAFVQDGFIMLGAEILMPVSEIRLRGGHNLENCLAAACVGKALAIPLPVIRKVLSSFEGVEHRCEPVETIGGVLYINDSKGTNYDSTIKAIESYEEPLVLILGGRDKGGAITPLVEAVSSRAKYTVLLGEAAPYFERVLQASHYERIIRADNLKEAVEKARERTLPGDVVLFSPACTSYDMFKNYEERGRAFKAIVRDLQNEA
ncbi:MAG: UDP-N-acetylmuramoyl-L-alanine--D-glutamate ligase [Bacteroidota bacterium]